ncbi:MAG: hypothetical protein COU10_01895 [Candidatus Harrisonbacteria bacterium CG10_big_fil_rev_8_21_14_0_10_45_28]|uniref:Resolvase HTH domain-containing protein n=1 Tax=Candidatus Harrisonbacteria bacterium CG10_big_fil_rev_8_21_14_0_10_45_28 TaxID=1974586 RepID=A0A2H0UNF9_9BACT|nr:MAG: hypothetical protein COU10_01895 [Candidatus Harrisonbacteria bacterium CG10_big_fil_rev_8_21_14_0_10_45_28]
MKRTDDEKKQTIKLRKQGKSIVEIERALSINRSTLSGWLKNTILTKVQIKKLENNKKRALIKARKKAALWHNEQKKKRLNVARKEAETVISQLNTKDSNLLDLALAFLYWGEGFKRNVETGMGNTDPEILKFFLKVLRKNYKLNVKKIRCELFLRADQDVSKTKKYWAKELGLPISCFKGVNIDQRTKGRKTYENYNGVCALRCGNVAIQRKLVNIYKQFSEKI